ncbi:globin, partial [Ostertagia ostertagi]
MYRKKPARSLSHGRYSNEMRRISVPKWRVEAAETMSVKSQGGSIYGRGTLTTPDSAESFLLPPTPDRKRSRSLCGVQMAQDAQAVGVAAMTKTNDDTRGASLTAAANGGSRKMSTGGLVPPTIGDAILKRAMSNRPEMRTFMSRLSDQQIDIMGKQFYSLIADSVEHIEHPEAVQQHAKAFGESYAALCQLGFRPDYFAPLADAAIAECVKLDGGAHKRCETLLAWSQLISAIFTSVRDGYYSRVRYQRRSSLPQGMISKQLSIDLTRSIDHDAYIQ